MGTVTGGTFDVAFHELYRVGGVCGCSLAVKRSNQIWRILQRQHQAEWMRTGEVVAKGVWRFHAAGHGKFSVGHGLSGSDAPVMATEAQVAVTSQHWPWRPSLVVGSTLICSVGLCGQSLVPERRHAADSGMG